MSISTYIFVIKKNIVTFSFGEIEVECIEFIGVLRHMQRYFSHICDGTDVQADWRRSCTYGWAPNAIDISQGSLTCPSYTDMGPTFLYGDSDTPLQLVAFYDTLGIRRTYSRLKLPASPRGIWLSPMTKAPIPTETSKKQRKYTKKRHQKHRLHQDCRPT